MYRYNDDNNIGYGNQLSHLLNMFYLSGVWYCVLFNKFMIQATHNMLMKKLLCLTQSCRCFCFEVRDNNGRLKN